MRKKKLLVLAALTLQVTNVSSALTEQRQQALKNQPTTQTSENFYERRSEGWYWYEDPQAKKKQQQKQLPPVVVQQPKKVDIYNPETNKYNEPIVVQATPAQPKPLSTEWLKVTMPKALQAAMDNPYDENGRPSKEMETYMYLQRFALDKSQNFAKSATTLTQLDPFLDETNRVPVDTASNRVFMAAAEKDRKDILNYLSKTTGLWFFYDTSCSFCTAQYEFLKDFKAENNFKIFNISMDGKRLPKMDNNEIILPDRGQAVNLRLRITPSIVLLVPPNNFYVVSQGLITQSSLESKILLVAEQQNLLPKYLKDKLDPYAKGVVTPQQMKRMQQLEKDLNDDPRKVVDLIKKAVGNE
ncbi:conjugal transfer protein TraF [Acinetobacter baumannii]